MLGGSVHVHSFNGGQPKLTVAELPTFACHNRACWELPRLIRDVGIDADDPETVAAERPCLDRTPDINSFVQERYKDEHWLLNIAPSEVEPGSNPSRDGADIMAVEWQAEVFRNLFVEVVTDFMIGRA